MATKCYIGILYYVGMIGRMKVVLAYSDVFNQHPPEDYLEFFTKYPTQNILIKIAQINAILFNRQPDSDYQVVHEVFHEQKEITDQMLALLIKTYGHGHYFVAPSLSMLIKHTLNHQQDLEYGKQSDDDFMSELLKTILIFNQTYNKQINGTEDLISFRSVFTLASLQQSYIRATKLPVYIIKSAFMCKFVSQDKQLRPFAIHYCQQYGLSDPWKVSKFLIELTKVNAMVETKFGIKRGSIPDKLLNDWIINQDSTDEGGLTLNFDIIPKPLYAINDQDTIVLDLAYFQYAVDQGFFFRIYKKSIEKSDSPLKNLNNFKSYIGNEFFEKFLCSKLLHKTFSHRQQIVVSNEKYQDFLIKSTSDNLLIIEVKMADTHASATENSNFDAFKKDVDDKLLSKKSNGSKNKGAYQIISQIQQLASVAGQQEVQDLFKVRRTHTLNIYPIILTSDTNYNLLGTNNYIMEQTEPELKKLRPLFKTIKPILVLNINSLIEFFPYLQSNRFHLTDLIKGYIREIKRWKRSFHINKDEYSYVMASTSFDDYMRNKLADYSIAHNLKPIVKHFGEDISDLSLKGLDS